MPDPIAFIDSALAALPPLLRIGLWACASGAFSMGLYAWLSPQKRLHEIKASQQEARTALMQHDGEWDELKSLIMKDLSLAFRQMRLIFVPFLVSVAPIIALIYSLYDIYGDQAYLGFGPDWMRGFEFCYFFVLLIVSLGIKVIFKIA